MKTTNFLAFVAAVLLCGISKCEATDFCYFADGNFEYCDYGCCSDKCCLEDLNNLSLILGLVFGIGGVVVVAVIIFCICRRRQTRGVVYRNQPAPGAVVITQTNQGMTTTNMQPGVAYGYGAPAYPGPGVQQPYVPGQPQPYPPQPQLYPAQPQPIPAVAQPPPTYSEIGAKQ